MITPECVQVAPAAGGFVAAVAGACLGNPHPCASVVAEAVQIAAVHASIRVRTAADHGRANRSRAFEWDLALFIWDHCGGACDVIARVRAGGGANPESLWTVGAKTSTRSRALL